MSKLSATVTFDASRMTMAARRSKAQSPPSRRFLTLLVTHDTRRHLTHLAFRLNMQIPAKSNIPLLLYTTDVHDMA